MPQKINSIGLGVRGHIYFQCIYLIYRLLWNSLGYYCWLYTTRVARHGLYLRSNRYVWPDSALRCLFPLVRRRSTIRRTDDSHETQPEKNSKSPSEVTNKKDGGRLYAELSTTCGRRHPLQTTVDDMCHPHSSLMRFHILPSSAHRPR